MYDKHKSFAAKLSLRSGRKVSAHPWTTMMGDRNPDVMDIQVGKHSAGEVNSFQVLAAVPTDDAGWENLEKLIFAMIEATKELGYE